MAEQDYGGLLRRSVLILVLTAAAVAVCYLWIDRPVAFFVHRREISAFHLFQWLTYPPPIVQRWSPLVLALCMVRRGLGPFARWQKVLFVACLSMIVADEFRTSLGDLFGRYWPETWFDHNPSLIGTGAYGFHPFHAGDDIGSFPSGHAARILGFAAVWWIALPRTRLLLIIICLPMLVSLVAMNYHFVGDVVAGSAVGWIVATYAAHLAQLDAHGIQRSHS